MQRMYTCIYRYVYVYIHTYLTLQTTMWPFLSRLCLNMLLLCFVCVSFKFFHMLRPTILQHYYFWLRLPHLFHILCIYGSMFEHLSLLTSRTPSDTFRCHVTFRHLEELEVVPHPPITRHRFGYHSGLDESSGRHSASFVYAIAFPVYLVFSRINVITKYD